MSGGSGECARNARNAREIAARAGACVSSSSGLYRGRRNIRIPRNSSAGDLSESPGEFLNAVNDYPCDTCKYAHLNQRNSSVCYYYA